MQLSFGRRIALLEHIMNTLEVTAQERNIIGQLLEAETSGADIMVDHITSEIIKGIAQKCRDQKIDPNYGNQVWIDEEPPVSNWYVFSRHEVAGWIAYSRQDLEATGRLTPTPEGDRCYIEVRDP